MRLQSLKSYLVSLGPGSPLVRTALRTHGHLHGFTLRLSDATISLRKKNREMILGNAQYVQVPIMMECHDLFFATIEPDILDGREVLDFSRPALHKYKRNGLSFHFPSVPEDDVMDAYTHWYSPKAGDVVWDAGAHAGATTYFLSQMVGSAGKVYAFEPDEFNYSYLIRNLEMHRAQNVIPVAYALDGSTGSVAFQVDGTMSAGIRGYLVYSGEGQTRMVPTLSLGDACQKLGQVPTYIKMDIEGAEVAVICEAKEFLKKNPIHFAVESYHRVRGEYTYKALDRFFPTIGYEVESSDRFGQMFTWARPKGA
jgi:FkbM family methyltransferase